MQVSGASELSIPRAKPSQVKLVQAKQGQAKSQAGPRQA